MVYDLLIASFLICLILIPAQIRKFVERGVVVPDYYKNDIRYVPTSGGLSVLVSFYVVIFLSSLKIFSEFISFSEIVAIFVIALYGLFGYIDDLVDIGRATKVVYLPLFAIPIAFVSPPIWIPFVGWISGALLILCVPVYVMVVANLVNMHSGFNGMASGLTAILLGSILIKSISTGKGSLVIPAAMLGSILAFLYYNKYPSKIFEGNTGAFAMGSAVGVSVVLGGFYISGSVMLIPHIVNFLLYLYWRLMRKLRPWDKKYELVKFGKVRTDKTIEAPNPYTLKWILPYYFRVTEKQVVLAMYALTAIFCLIGYFIPY